MHENHKNHTLEVEVKCFAYIRCWCNWAWICWSVDISNFSNKTFTRCESCRRQVVDGQKQKLHNESACSNHNRHGHNNIEQNKHPKGAKCNGALHNACKQLALENASREFQVMKTRQAFKDQNVTTNWCNTKSSLTNHH